MHKKSKKLPILWGVLVLLTPVIVWASNLTVPNTFTAGTSISSAQMNANFSAVQTAVNSKQDVLTANCAAGNAVTQIGTNGTTGTYTCTAFQQPTTASCAAGYALTAIGSSGTSSCTAFAPNSGDTNYIQNLPSTSAAQSATFNISGVNSTITGVTWWDNGLIITGNAAAGTGMSLWNTNTGGHRWALFSGSSGDSTGPGGFGLYDDTAGSYALIADSSSNIVVPHQQTTYGPGFFNVAAGGYVGINTQTASSCVYPNHASIMLYGTELFDQCDGNFYIRTAGSVGTAVVDGNFVVTGTKSFVQEDPEDSTKEIDYVALEGGEAGTYARGTATLHHGLAQITLAHHFSLVTNSKGLTVQVTPSGDCQGWVAVTHKSTTSIDLEERGAKDDCQVDYLVQGVRKGYEDHRVIRPRALATR